MMQTLKPSAILLHNQHQQHNNSIGGTEGQQQQPSANQLPVPYLPHHHHHLPHHSLNYSNPSLFPHHPPHHHHHYSLSQHPFVHPLLFQQHFNPTLGFAQQQIAVDQQLPPAVLIANAAEPRPPSSPNSPLRQPQPNGIESSLANCKAPLAKDTAIDCVRQQKTERQQTTLPARLAERQGCCVNGLNEPNPQMVLDLISRNKELEGKKADITLHHFFYFCYKKLFHCLNNV